MNGAETLVRTLVGSGVNACFGNPGTSEMPFRRGPRQGRRHADRAGSFRGRRNGDGRGLRPHGGKVSAATLPNSRVQEGGPAVSQPVEPCLIQEAKIPGSTPQRRGAGAATI